MGSSKAINDYSVRTPFPAALQIENKIHAVVNYELARACRLCNRRSRVE